MHNLDESKHLSRVDLYVNVMAVTRGELWQYATTIFLDTLAFDFAERITHNFNFGYSRSKLKIDIHLQRQGSVSFYYSTNDFKQQEVIQLA